MLSVSSPTAHRCVTFERRRWDLPACTQGSGWTCVKLLLILFMLHNPPLSLGEFPQQRLVREAPKIYVLAMNELGWISGTCTQSSLYLSAECMFLSRENFTEIKIIPGFASSVVITSWSLCKFLPEWTVKTSSAAGSSTKSPFAVVGRPGGNFKEDSWVQINIFLDSPGPLPLFPIYICPPETANLW